MDLNLEELTMDSRERKNSSLREIVVPSEIISGENELFELKIEG